VTSIGKKCKFFEKSCIIPRFLWYILIMKALLGTVTIIMLLISCEGKSAAEVQSAASITGAADRAGATVQASAPTPSGDLQALVSRAGLMSLKETLAAPDFTLPLMGGGQVKLSDLRGKAVFVNFWATWCPPCRAEMPSMNRLYDEFKDRGLEFIAVDMQEKPEDVEKFVADGGYTFPVALDQRGSTSMIYGIQSIPTTFIIDKEGNVAAAAIGAREWNSAAVHAVIEYLVTQ
jgi:peroxiredoxin